MEDFSALNDGERTFQLALTRHGVRFMLVGLSAAVLQGANTATRGIDLWFEDITQLGGDALGDRLDVVAHRARPRPMRRRAAQYPSDEH